MYLLGDGVEYNEDIAARHFEKGAARGSEQSRHMLGKLLIYGESTPQNIPRALVLIQKSASQGYDPAKYTLAVLYAEGVYTNKNIEESKKYLCSIKNNRHAIINKFNKRLELKLKCF